MPAPGSEAVTFEGLLERLKQDVDLTASARRDMSSALRVMARIVGRPLRDIIADPAIVRELIAKAPWQLANVSAARWHNIRSNVGRAMVTVGVKVHRQRRNYKLTAEWQALLDPIARRDRDELRRFAGWCSTIGITPHAVTSEAFERFLKYMMNQSLQRNPRERAHVARRAWNRAVVRDNATYPHIPAPDCALRSAVKLSELHPGLASDIAAYKAWATTADPLTDDRKVIKPVTVHHYITRLRVLVDFLEESGLQRCQFDSLAALIQPAMVMRGMNVRIAGATELSDAQRQYLHSIAVAALSAASFIGMQDDARAQLRKLTRKVKFTAHGMCEKNKQRLYPMLDEDGRERILQLPLKVSAALTKVTNPTVRQAQRMQLAALLEILLHVPMRIRNAAELDLGATICRPAASQEGSWIVAIPGHAVKNGVAIDGQFNLMSSQLLARFVDHFRPVLSQGNTTRFFLTQAGTPLGQSALSKQLARFVKRETGLVIHAHLLRHYAAHLHLLQHPGQFAQVAKMLGHKSVDTTMRFYAGLSAQSALNSYDEHIQHLRAEFNQKALSHHAKGEVQ